MLPELSQLSGYLPVAPVSRHELLVQLIFEVVPDRGPAESARVALTELGERVAPELEARGREIAGPRRMEIRYFGGQVDQWMACLPGEAAWGAAALIRVRTRPVAEPVQPAVDAPGFPRGHQLRQFGLPALEAP
ncbi:hypothetical protein ACFWY5_23630 [Nonomuraea sp. NPDC059007]|uniref:hypothetical protein n=1 Tax=Nonomuraea sp. NPDC059007 TaxID=3346692 RepID=UPI0036BCD803